MSPAVLERFTRFTALGLRFLDDATGAPVAEGLAVSLVRPPGLRAVRATMTPSGSFAFADLPGLAALEHADPEDAGAPPAPVPYLVEVHDTAGRFLPLRVRVAAPTTGAPAVRLFSAPARPAPPGMAVVRMALETEADRAPAAHALVEVHLDGARVGRGVADARGQLVAVFAGPALPGAIGSPGLGRPGPLRDQAWTVELRAAHDPALDPTTPPERDAVLGQPPVPLLTAGAPPQPLGGQTLRFGRDLVVPDPDLSPPAPRAPVLVGAPVSPP